jgi:hypothetical protein
MSSFLKNLIAACIFLRLIGSASIDATPQGFLEGQLKILARRSVELADENTATLRAQNYADYPLIILSRGEKKEIARISADRNGNYRAALPPGDYILDVEGRMRKRLRVRSQPFTIVPNETVHVDMTIVTGSSAEAIAPQE